MKKYNHFQKIFSEKNYQLKVNDINRLEKIKKEVIKAERWDDFVRVFRNHK
jgi:hypothetical protein